MYFYSFLGRRSRSRSPDSRGSTPIQDHGDKDYRYGVDISSQPPSLSSIVNVPPHSESYRPRPPPRPRCRDFDGKRPCPWSRKPPFAFGPLPLDHFGPMTLNLIILCVIKTITIFFIMTEKGFCMRGDLCPYDHGLDPVVVDDVSLGGVLAFPRGKLTI